MGTRLAAGDHCNYGVCFIVLQNSQDYGAQVPAPPDLQKSSNRVRRYMLKIL